MWNMRIRLGMTSLKIMCDQRGIDTHSKDRRLDVAGRLKEADEAKWDEFEEDEEDEQNDVE